jgi:hypothetical protein
MKKIISTENVPDQGSEIRDPAGIVSFRISDPGSGSATLFRTMWICQELPIKKSLANSLFKIGENLARIRILGSVPKSYQSGADLYQSGTIRTSFKCYTGTGTNF